MPHSLTNAFLGVYLEGILHWAPSLYVQRYLLRHCEVGAGGQVGLVPRGGTSKQGGHTLWKSVSL